MQQAVGPRRDVGARDAARGRVLARLRAQVRALDVCVVLRVRVCDGGAEARRACRRLRDGGEGAGARVGMGRGMFWLGVRVCLGEDKVGLDALDVEIGAAKVCAAAGGVEVRAEVGDGGRVETGCRRDKGVLVRAGDVWAQDVCEALRWL